MVKLELDTGETIVTRSDINRNKDCMYTEGILRHKYLICNPTAT